MKTKLVLAAALCGFLAPLAQAASPNDGSVLPFPPTPSASVAGPTVQESKMTWRVEPERLKPGAPNILIVLIDDVGFGLPDTFGGEVHTPDADATGADGHLATTPFTRPRFARRPAPHC